MLLNQSHGITLQMGGSDQFGNITAGVELSRKINDKKVHAITTPLLTKSDGTKFGKSEEGNIWLDATLTSPYKFYQFWINGDDADISKFMRYFSLKTREEMEKLEATESHQNLKRLLAEEMTRRLHGDEAYQAVLLVSNLLFDAKADSAALRALNADLLGQVANEIPSPEVEKSVLAAGINIVDLLSDTKIQSSKTEAKKAIQNNAISVNKQKISALDTAISTADLLHGRFVMVENGKKNKYLVQIG